MLVGREGGRACELSMQGFWREWRRHRSTLCWRRRAHLWRSFLFLDRIATWCEGCYCHQSRLDDRSKPWKDRAEAYEKASCGCPWKGRRGVELALGAMPRLLEKFRRSVQGSLDPIHKWLPCAHRIEMVRLVTTVCDRIDFICREKQGIWGNLPYKIVGVFGVILEVINDKDGKRIARECIA